MKNMPESKASSTCRSCDEMREEIVYLRDAISRAINMIHNRKARTAAAILQQTRKPVEVRR